MSIERRRLLAAREGFAMPPRRCARRDPVTPCPTRHLGTLGSVAEVDGKPLDERLQEIGAQLAWVRDYL
jgi:hypothetical protein